MNEALCSILCGEQEWIVDAEGRTIKFNSDGAGELICRCNFNWWIAAQFKWKSIKPLNGIETLGSIGRTSSTIQKIGAHHLGNLILEITLTRQDPDWMASYAQSVGITERTLTYDAFLPKLYSISIEKGSFREPCRVGNESPWEFRFALRLLFDKSPFPPRSEWKSPEEGPDDGQFWDLVEFVGRSDQDLKRKGRAMNDDSSAVWISWVFSPVARMFR